MKLKLLSTLILLGTCATFTAGAKGFNFGDYTGKATKGCVSVYDNDNMLSKQIPTSLANTDYGLVTEDLHLTKGTYSHIKLYIPEDNLILGDERPTEIDVDEYFNEYSDIYERDIYAYTAPAMVKKNKTDYVNDEVAYRATILIWGKEDEVVFKEDCKITSCSESYPDAYEASAAYLKPGDVITINYPFKDGQNNISLLYRPSKNDPLKTLDAEKGFYPLYTAGGYTGGKWPMASSKGVGYYFGIVEKTENRYLTLLTANGERRYAVDIDFTDETSTYFYNIEDTQSAEVITPYNIYPSIFEDGEFDEDLNLIIKPGSEPKCYALIRTLDGTAVDIMFFDGYK